jgi:alkylation response protein AidB-like acyl-CoA dehydrogenase
MDFALTPDQEKIRDTAESFLRDASDSAAVRRAMDTEAGYDPRVWSRISQELGWCATHIPEAYDGLELGWVELTLLLEQMGRRLLCAPFFATVCMAATALMEAADDAAQKRYLPEIASGRLTATIALAESGIDWRPAAVRAIARRAGDGYSIDGSFRHVPDGAQAALILVPARLEGSNALGLFAIPGDTAGASRIPLKTIDATRRLAEVKLDKVRVAGSALIGEGSRVSEGLARTCALAAIALAAEQLGGAQQCLDMTLAYTAERVQFGRPIASFQAVKHRCAQMMVSIEATRSAVYGAACVAAAGAASDALAMESACAKTLASETFFFCAQEAIQLHGGVGFTWEYDPHLYFKRAHASGSWLGAPDVLRERVAAALLDRA